ncbi:class I SAM-dependent methyltransferase [Streptomyces nigrescens]|uniref:class I SAM-dependent methyltransferase n=1 Tax=Streptomyces nigrescens TaxID=1920 RepID=UPI00348DDF57
MTYLSAEHDAAVTDRAILTGSAYNTGRDLSARQSIYQWQTPRHDLPGIVVEQLEGTRGTVVDVGCGNGKFIERLRRDRPEMRLLGLDVALGILAGVPRPVAVADAARLPLASTSVDGALALHMLYHVEDVPTAIKELARVVKPGGVVIASTNSARDKAELDHLWERAAGGDPTDEGVPAPACGRSGDAVFEGAEAAPEVVENPRLAAAYYFTTVIRSAFGGVRGLFAEEWAVR